jgi:hypothetical protein
MGNDGNSKWQLGKNWKRSIFSEEQKWIHYGFAAVFCWENPTGKLKNWDNNHAFLKIFT